MKAILTVVCAVMLSSNAVAAIKCESDRNGGMCCWDTKVDGPFRPINC
jgi:hypothetical protein